MQLIALIMTVHVALSMTVNVVLKWGSCLDAPIRCVHRSAAVSQNCVMKH